MAQKYPLAADTFGPDEIAAAKAVLDSGRLTMGAEVLAFERELAEWTGAAHAVMVNSGSSANLLMADALLRPSQGEAPLRPGDEVLVPALSWPTTVWPLAQLGLVPVFVDIDPMTLAISLESAASALTEKTRGMFLIHVLGRVPDMQLYRRFCTEHGLTLIEDACESLGGHSGERHVGTHGLMGSFSFYFSHHISTIEGGAIITSDRALCDDLRSLRAHGWVRDRSDKGSWTERHASFDERFLFISGGYNVRPMELQAAIGRVQLRRLDAMLEAREDLACKVAGWVGEAAPWLRLIGSETLPKGGRARSRRQRTHSWMTLPFLLTKNAPLDVVALKQRLEQAGIETRPIIAGNLARHPGVRRFSCRAAESLAAADELLERGFMCGCHPVLAPGAVESLEAALRSLVKV